MRGSEGASETRPAAEARPKRQATFSVWMEHLPQRMTRLDALDLIEVEPFMPSRLVPAHANARRVRDALDAADVPSTLSGDEIANAETHPIPYAGHRTMPQTMAAITAIDDVNRVSDTSAESIPNHVSSKAGFIVSLHCRQDCR